MKYCHHLSQDFGGIIEMSTARKAMQTGTGVWQHSTNLVNKSQIKYQTSNTQRVDLRETEGKWVTELT